MSDFMSLSAHLACVSDSAFPALKKIIKRLFYYKKMLTVPST